MAALRWYTKSKTKHRLAREQAHWIGLRRKENGIGTWARIYQWEWRVVTVVFPQVRMGSGVDNYHMAWVGRGGWVEHVDATRGSV